MGESGRKGPSILRSGGFGRFRCNQFAGRIFAVWIRREALWRWVALCVPAVFYPQISQISAEQYAAERRFVSFVPFVVQTSFKNLRKSEKSVDPTKVLKRESGVAGLAHPGRGVSN